MKTNECNSKHPNFTEDNDTNSRSDDIEDDYEDEDICSVNTLEQLFKHKYKIHDEPAVTFDNNYVLSLTKDDCFTCIAAGLSDGSVRIFEINSEKGLYIQPPVAKGGNKEKLNICGVRFVDETPNLLLVGTSNGLVRLLDLRTRNEVSRFENIPASNLEPRDIAAFDRNSNSRFLCMGTVQKGNNVNLLFYDLRTSNQLFSYFESHQDEVTSLHFHPQNPNYLLSGSMDGLINIFDISATNEDDAILTTVNTEDTVYKLNWHKNAKNNDTISCITHTSCFKSYEFDGDVIAEFDRSQITQAVQRKKEVNLISCHSTIDNEMMLLTGTNSKNGGVLRSLTVNNGHLSTHANFIGNSQIIRESIYDPKTSILITAGERGFVTLWTPYTWNSSSTIYNNTDNCSTPNDSPSCSFKMKNRKSNKFAPY